MDEKVREIEESLEEKYLLWYEEGKYLLSRIKKLEDVQEFTTKNIFFLQEELDKARARIRELVEGIEKHRMNTWGYGEDVDGKMWQVENDIDEKLYKLIEKEKP